MGEPDGKTSGSFFTSIAVIMRVAVIGDILYIVYPFEAIRMLIKSNFMVIVIME